MHYLKRIGVLPILASLLLASACTSNPDPDGVNITPSVKPTYIVGGGANKVTINPNEVITPSPVSTPAETQPLPSPSSTIVPSPSETPPIPVPTPIPTPIVAPPVTTPAPVFTPVPVPPPSPTPTPTPTVKAIAAPSGVTLNPDVAGQLVTLINNSRAQAGASALKVDPLLTTKANNWAITMAVNTNYSAMPNLSTGLPTGWKSLSDLAAYLSAGNIPVADKLYVLWGGSQGKIVSKAYSKVGVGVACRRTGDCYASVVFWG